MLDTTPRSSGVRACLCTLAFATACSSKGPEPVAPDPGAMTGTTQASPGGSGPTSADNSAGASSEVPSPNTDGAAPSGMASAPNMSSPDGSGNPDTPPATSMGGAGMVSMEPAANSGTGAPADAWLRIGYDIKNQYFNPAEKTLSVENAAQIKELWRFEVAGYPPGSPTVVDGKVYALSTGGIYAIDLNNGQQVWTRDDIIGTSTIAYENGFLYVHASGTERAVAELHKLNASDGTTVWGPVITYDEEGCDAFSSAQVANGTVFVGHSCGARELALDGTNKGPRGGIEAFDTETGERRYTYWVVPEGGEDGAMSWSTVAIDVMENAVYASTGNNYTVGGPNSDAIHKFDFSTGERQWVTQVTMGDIWGLATGNVLDEDFGASPILADVDGMKLVACGDKGSRFWAFDRATGSILWSRKMLTPSRSPANGGILNNGGFDGTGFIFVANDPNSNTSTMFKVNPLTGEDLWTAKYTKMAWGSPSMANGLVVAPINDDLFILNAETGEQLAMFNTGGTTAGGSAAIAQGKIVVKSGLSYPLSADVINNNQIIAYGLP
jgi:polyvinyl alcohol dehydrogenase (cytochrome)